MIVGLSLWTVLSPSLGLRGEGGVMLLLVSPLASSSSIPRATRRRRRDVIVGLSFGQLFFLHPLGYEEKEA